MKALVWFVWTAGEPPERISAASERLAARKYLMRRGLLSQRSGLKATREGWYGIDPAGNTTPVVLSSRESDFEGLCDGAEMMPLSEEDKT